MIIAGNKESFFVLFVVQVRLMLVFCSSSLYSILSVILKKYLSADKRPSGWVRQIHMETNCNEKQWHQRWPRPIVIWNIKRLAKSRPFNLGSQQSAVMYVVPPGQWQWSWINYAKADDLAWSEMKMYWNTTRMYAAPALRRT